MAYTVEEFLKLDLSVPDNNDGPQKDDCYFDELSNLVETHPVGLPTLRRTRRAR